MKLFLSEPGRFKENLLFVIFFCIYSPLGQVDSRRRKVLEEVLVVWFFLVSEICFMIVENLPVSEKIDKRLELKSGKPFDLGQSGSVT